MTAYHILGKPQVSSDERYWLECYDDTDLLPIDILYGGDVNELVEEAEWLWNNRTQPGLYLQLIDTHEDGKLLAWWEEERPEEDDEEA